MRIDNKLTVVIEVTGRDDVDALKDFLGLKAQDRSAEASLSYEKKRADDFEAHADKLAAAIRVAASEVREQFQRMTMPIDIEAILNAACTKMEAVAAQYQRDQIPF